MMFAPMAQAATLMGPAEPGKPERWTPIEGSPPVRSAKEDRRAVLELPCPFSKLENWRAAWDIELPRGGRVPVYPGLYVTYGPGKDQDADMAVAQIAASRELGAQGFVLFEMEDQILGGLLPLLRLGLTSR